LVELWTPRQRSVEDGDTETVALYGLDNRLGRAPFVPMMQTTDLRERDNLACSGWVYRAALGTVLAE
jgi:hypothetical protein